MNPNMLAQSDGEGLQVCVPARDNLEYLYTEKEIAKPFKLHSVGYGQDRILTVDNEEAKEVQFPGDLGQFYSTPKPPKRICGLPRTTFWLVFTITVLLAVIGVICGIIAGIISNRKNSPPTLSQTTLINGTSTMTNSIRLSSTSSLGAPTTSASILVPSPSDIGDAIYLGCYQDQTRRTLTGNVTSSPHMTNDMCATYCKEFTYFGTEFVNQCYCGDEISNGGALIDESKCQMECSGDSSICGGSWTLSLWQNQSTGN